MLQRNFPDSAVIAGKKSCTVLIKCSFLDCAASTTSVYKVFRWLLWDWMFVFLLRIGKKVL